MANTVWINPNAGPYCNEYSFIGNHKNIVQNPILNETNSFMLFLSGRINHAGKGHWKISTILYGQDKQIQLIQITARAPNLHTLNMLFVDILADIKKYSIAHSDQCQLSFYMPHDDLWIIYGRAMSSRLSSAEAGLSATLLTAPFCFILLYARRHILPSSLQPLRLLVKYILRSIVSIPSSIFK